MTVGTQGDDVLNGTPEADSISGLGGNDDINGSSGNDTLLGGAGIDTIFGSAGHDSIDGGADDDWMWGSEGNDTIFGGDGNDMLNGGNGANRLDGGAGIDTASYIDMFVPVSVNLATGVGGADTLTGIENVLGGRTHDLLIGNDGANYLYGNDWNDTLQGAGGDDTLRPGFGLDVVDGGAGVDLVQIEQPRANYNLARTSGGFTINHKTGNTESNTLSNVERVHFDYGWGEKIALDLDGNAGIVAKLLGAVFGAPALGSASTVGIGLYYADFGLGYEQLAQLALEVRLGIGASSEDVVRLLYSNLTGQQPAAEALTYFKGLIDGGGFTAATLAMLAADTDMNAQNIGLAGLMETGLVYA